MLEQDSIRDAAQRLGYIREWADLEIGRKQIEEKDLKKSHEFSGIPRMAFPKKKKKYRSPVEGPLRRLPGQSVREERERLFDDKVIGYLLAALVTWLLAGWQWLYW